MTQELGGSGSAEDAAVSFEPVATEGPDQLAVADQIVAAAQAKVDKQREHLAGAEAALAAAVAARDALSGR